MPDSPRSLWTPAGEHAVAQPFPMARYAAPAGGVDRSPAVREMRLNRQATEKRTASVRRTASYGDGFAGGGFGGGGGGGSQINLATSRPRDPMWYWRQNNLPYQYQDESEASLIRQFASLIYMTHPVIASCIDTYSLWPMTGMKITAKDPKVEEFHQTLFFDTLDYESYLPSVLKQTWLRGEAFPLGQFDDTLGIWEDDQLIDPDSVKVIDSPFFREPRYEMRIPESIRQIVRDRSPEWEFRQLVRSQPDIVRHAEMGDYIPVDNTLMRHIALKMDDFHPRGVSILMRAFRSITQEEMLNAALDACLVAGTPILTQQGVSYIEDIKKGDLVLTHQGRYRKVLHTMKREANEPGVTIKPRYEREITMTGEHPVLVRRKMVRPGVCYHCRAKVGHRETVCDAHALTSRPNEKHRHRRGICRICGETASSARTTYCQGHDPLTSTEVYEGWMPSKDIAVFDEMWHPHQPGREKVSDGYWVEVSRVVHHQVQETVYNFEVQEDNSYCAPLAVHNCASRLYTPLILVKLGASASDMGTDVAWVPSEEQLEDFNAALDMALLGDFRVLTSHFATDISAVFGKEVMPSFAEDFDRIMERQLMVFGLSETLLTGASDGGTYAADALNRDVVSILLKRAQRWMQRFFRDRAEPVAEAQEHFDYEESAGVKKVIYRDVKEVDEESGEVRIVRKPKLMLPELSFDVLNLNDRDTERQFVEALAASGLPISRRTRLRSLADIDLDDEITALSDENVDMAVATAETAKRTYLALKATGAPIPQNLIDAYEPKAVTPDAATVASEGAPLPDMAMDPPPETMGLSASPEDYAAAEAAGEMPPDAPPASGIFPASTAPLTLMSPVPAEGAQRPPESDEARGRMPKAARRSRTLRAPQKAPETKDRDIEGYGIYEIG